MTTTDSPKGGTRNVADVMVTGGSGFVGSHLVKSLAEQKRSVVSLYHHRLPETLENVYPVCSDMSSAELMAAPLRGVETVVHLAWDGGLSGPRGDINWDPAISSRLPRNVQMVRNLVQAMERAGTRRLIFVSAIGASRRSHVPFLMEKYLSEFFILNSKIPEKIIIRSSILWGGDRSEDRFLRSILNLMKFPLYPIPRKVDGFSPVHVDDMVETVIKLINEQITTNHSILEMAGQESYAPNELFRLVRDRYIKGTRIPLPGLIGHSLLPLFERQGGGEGRNPRLTDFLVVGSRCDETTERRNPLCDQRPESFRNMRELLTTQAPESAVADDKSPSP